MQICGKVLGKDRLDLYTRLEAENQSRIFS